MDWNAISEAIAECEKTHPVMDLSTKKGSTVIFTYPENGRDEDIERAAEKLILNVEYTVEKVIVASSLSFIKLKEVPSVAFNTVQFTNKLEGE